MVDWLSAPDAPPTTPPAAPMGGGTGTNWLNAPPTGAPKVPTATEEPSQDLGWSDIPGALMAGARKGIGDVGQTVEMARRDSTGLDTTRLDATSGTHPAAGPFKWSDLVHPGAALSKFAYRAGEGSPTVAGGIGGGLLGTAASGNPLVGLGAGAVGAAAGAALQTLGPAFQRELQASPHDPDAAWTRALKSTAASGAFAGASWSLFPARFFEGPVKSLAFQVLGIQPGLAVAHQATENVMHDQAPLQGAGQAYTEGVVGTALPMAGAKAVSHLGGQKPQVTPGKPPETHEGMEALAHEKYEDLARRGISYPNVDELRSLQAKMHKTLYDAEGDSRDQPGVYDAINDLDKPRQGGTDVDFADIKHVRGRLNGQLSNPDMNTRRIARIALNSLDDWLSDHKAQERAGVDPAVSQGLANDYKDARKFWHASKAMAAWDAVQDRIDTASNPESRRRSEIYRIVNNPKLHWQYPPEAIDLMKASLNKGFMDKVNAYTQWFSPHSATGLITDFMLHHFSGPMGLVAPIASELLRRHVQKPLERTTEGVPHILRNKPFGPIPKQLGVMDRTGQAANPLVGPVTPQAQPQQQYAEGGTADMPIPDERSWSSSFSDRLQASGAPVRDPELTEDRRNGPVKPPYATPFWYDTSGQLPRDAGVFDIAPRKNQSRFGYQEGGDVESTPFDDVLNARRSPLDDPRGQPANLDDLRNRMTPSYFKDTPSSPQADEALANPFAQPGKIGPPSGPPTTMEQIGGFAADAAANALPVGKAAGAAKAMFFPAGSAAIEAATKLLKEGASEKDIWRQLGVFKGADNVWRREKLGPTSLHTDTAAIGPGGSKKGMLASHLDAPHIYNENATIGRIPTTIHDPQGEHLSILGSFNAIPQPNIWARPQGTPQVPLLDTLTHETQHAVDYQSGLLGRPSAIGDPDWYTKGMKGQLAPDDPFWSIFEKHLHDFGYQTPRPLQPGVAKPPIPSAVLAAARNAVEFERYRRTVHEVMARNTEGREKTYNNMYRMYGSPLADRWAQEHPPGETEDITRELQMKATPFRKSGGKVERALACARRVA